MTMADPVCSLTGPYAYDPNVVVLWNDHVGDVQAPTEDEVMAAVNLIDDFDLTDIIGWELESDIIVVPPWGEFATQRVGGTAVPRSELLFAADRSGDDIRMLLAERDPGNVLFLPSGPYLDYPDAPLQVFPVRVAAITQLQRIRSGGASLLRVQFAIRGVPGNHVRVVTGS